MKASCVEAHHTTSVFIILSSARYNDPFVLSQKQIMSTEVTPRRDDAVKIILLGDSAVGKSKYAPSISICITSILTYSLLVFLNLTHLQACGKIPAE